VNFGSPMSAWTPAMIAARQEANKAASLAKSLVTDQSQ
jgi:hypothetical protein